MKIRLKVNLVPNSGTTLEQGNIYKVDLVLANPVTLVEEVLLSGGGDIHRINLSVYKEFTEEVC